MREMTKIVLSVCTVCALGAAHDARAQSTQPPGQNPPTQAPPPTVPPPIPTDTPAPTLPNKPGDIPAKPSDPAVPTSTPTSPAVPPVADPSAPNAPVPPVTDPNAPVQPPTDTAPVPPAPVTSSTTTTTTTTTTTDVGTETDMYAWSEPLLPSGIGVSAILGGGVGGFTDKQMRTTTADIGGLWDLRVALGSHLPLALEIGYMGSATNIDGLPTGNKGRLIGTTIESDLRFNIMPHMPFTPYVFAGMGWQRYDVTNTHVSLADTGVANHDNLMVFPLGVGMAYRLSGFVADVRGTFRYTTDNELVLSNPSVLLPTPNDFVPMHSWEASAAVGYEF